MKGLRVPASLVLFLLAVVVTVSEVNGKALASPEADPEPAGFGRGGFGRGRPGFSQRPNTRPLNSNSNPKPQTPQTAQVNNNNNNKPKPQNHAQPHSENNGSGNKKSSMSDAADQLSDALDQLGQSAPQAEEQLQGDVASVQSDEPSIDVVSLESNSHPARLDAAAYTTD